MKQVGQEIRNAARAKNGENIALIDQVTLQEMLRPRVVGDPVLSILGIKWAIVQDLIANHGCRPLWFRVRRLLGIIYGDDPR
jgi:hypothetical protein